MLTCCTICSCACLVRSRDDTICADCLARNFSGNPMEVWWQEEALALAPAEVERLLAGSATDQALSRRQWHEEP